jgi:hypothetical protein
MSLQNDLLALEKQFWSGDAAFYRQNLDDECLTVFTEMAGVQTKEEVAGMVAKDSRRWQDLTIDEKGLVEPTRDVAILSYEARATRGNGERYKALVSSGYVRRNGAWKLAFHQQTPLDTH